MTLSEELLPEGIAQAPEWALGSDAAAEIADWPLERRVGQMLMMAFPGPRVPLEFTRFIEEAGLGGILLFGDNVQSPWQGRELTDAIQEIARDAGLPPMFIAIDQEGGSVSRLQYPITSVPSPMAIAATGNIDNASRIAEVLASELADLGINFNLAPVVDVNSNPRNPVIGPRAYGDRAADVAAFAERSIAAHHERGLLVAAKHFPGHGDALIDSHHDLPAVRHDAPRIRSVELAPFIAAINAGVDAIMTAHVVFPALDATGQPATLSRPILHDLLRRQLGFRGLIVSDAIEMNAIAQHYGQVAGAVRAVAAGVEILVSVGSPAEQVEIQRALVQAVRTGQIAEERVNEAVARILGAKRGLRLRSDGVMLSPWPRYQHQLTARQVARESITIVRDEAGLVPIHLAPAQRLGLVEFKATRSSPVEERHVLSVLDLLARTRHGNTRTLLVDSSYANSISAALAFVSECDVLLLATRNAIFDSPQAELARTLLETGKPTVMLALRSPYDILAVPSAPCYLASYGDQACALEAAIGALFGDFIADGRLPFRLD